MDTTTGEIAGQIPYQPAVTKEYKFTIEALRQIGSTTNTATQLYLNNIGVGQTWSGNDNVSFVDFATNQFISTNKETGWIVFNTTPVTSADSGTGIDQNVAYTSSGILDKNVWVVVEGRVVATLQFF